MDLLLVILKYLGTGISGAAGIWGTVSETRDPKTGALSRWGKWALGLAIGGFVVALGAQIVEQIRDTRDQVAKEIENTQRVQALNDQLALSKEQLALSKADFALSEKNLAAVEKQNAELMAVKTKFEKLAVSLLFELPASDPQVKSLAQVFEKLTAQGGTPNAVWPKAPGSHLPNIISIAPTSRFVDPKISALLSSHANFVRSLKKAGGFWVGIDREKTGGEKLAAANPANYDSFVHLVDADELNPGGTLYYSPKSQRLFYAPPELKSDGDWIRNGKVVGITDLNRATLTIVGAPPLAKMRLVECQITFDTFPCTLTTFNTLTNNSVVRYTATLLEAENISSGKAFVNQKFLHEL